MICGVLYCAIASDLDTPSRSFKLFFSENKYSLLLWSLVKSSSNEGIDNADDLERALKVISGTIYIYGFIAYQIHATHIMYELH